MIRVWLGQRLTAAASVIGGAVGSLAYFLVLLDFGTDLTRRAHALGFASNFFDLQARAFLSGRLDIPAGSIGIEGFEIGDKTYMYFPPFPALVRLPIFLVTDRFDGRLTLVMMAVAFALYAVMAARLVWLIRSCLRHGPLSAGEAVAGGIFIALVTGGTVLTFDASLPWVYHEVYVWAAALVVGALYWFLRVMLDPQRGHIVALLGFTMAAILTRTTGGFAVAITVLAVGAWTVARRSTRGGRGTGLLLIATGALPILASAAYNWAKFRHPYLFPLESQVWTRVNEHRRVALEANGGTITGPQFLPTTLVNYFRPDGIRFTAYFPWVSLPAEPARAVGATVVDQTYRTGSVPAFNPLLFTLSVLALRVLAKGRRSASVRALTPVVVAAAGVAGGIMMYGYLTMRYTTEFVPLLVVAGAIGFWSVLTRWARGTRRHWRAGMTLMAVLTLFSIGAHMITGVTATAFTSRGPVLRDYVRTQVQLNGTPDGALAPLVHRFAGDPSGGTADDLGVVGDCSALYVHSGDAYDPWVLVERRNRAVELTASSDVSAGEVTLFDITSDEPRHVVMQIDSSQNALIFIRGREGDALGAYLPVHANSVVRVGVGVDSATGMAVVSASPGGRVARVPLAHWNAEWVSQPGTIQVPTAAATDAQALGLTLSPMTTPELPLCNAVAASARP